MRIKNILMYALLFATSQSALSMGKSFGAEAGESIKSGIDNLAGQITPAVGAAKDVAGATNNVAGSINNVAGAVDNAVDRTGKAVSGLFALGAVWSIGSSIKSWVWPSRADKVVAMATNEAYNGLSAKCALKQCMRANLNSPRDQFGFPLVCKDQACEYAFEEGDEKAEAMGRTFNKFYPIDVKKA